MRCNRRMACAILDVTQEKFKLLIDTGIVPAGAGLGPRSLTWDRDELIAIRDGMRVPAPAPQPTASAA